MNMLKGSRFKFQRRERAETGMQAFGIGDIVNEVSHVGLGLGKRTILIEMDLLTFQRFEKAW